MSKAKPKFYFPSPYVAQISHRAVTSFDDHPDIARPRFGTWDEAHAWLVKHSEEKIADCKKELASLKRQQKRIAAMAAKETK